MAKRSQKRIPDRTKQGKLIRSFRDSLGLSQECFGALLGISQSTVANYETGGRAPKKKVESALIRLAEEHKFPMTFTDLRDDD